MWRNCDGSQYFKSGQRTSVKRVSKEEESLWRLLTIHKLYGQLDQPRFVVSKHVQLGSRARIHQRRWCVNVDIDICMTTNVYFDTEFPPFDAITSMTATTTGTTISDVNIAEMNQVQVKDISTGTNTSSTTSFSTTVSNPELPSKQQKCLNDE